MAGFFCVSSRIIGTPLPSAEQTRTSPSFFGLGLGNVVEEFFRLSSHPRIVHFQRINRERPTEDLPQVVRRKCKRRFDAEQLRELFHQIRVDTAGKTHSGVQRLEFNLAVRTGRIDKLLEIVVTEDGPKRTRMRRLGTNQGMPTVTGDRRTEITISLKLDKQLHELPPHF